MNATEIFILLGLSAFVFVFLLVLSMEGVLFAGISTALLLLIAFVIALVLYLAVKRVGA